MKVLFSPIGLLAIAVTFYGMCHSTAVFAESFDNGSLRGMYVWKGEAVIGGSRAAVVHRIYFDGAGRCYPAAYKVYFEDQLPLSFPAAAGCTYAVDANGEGTLGGAVPGTTFNVSWSIIVLDGGKKIVAAGLDGNYPVHVLNTAVIEKQ